MCFLFLASMNMCILVRTQLCSRSGIFIWLEVSTPCWLQSLISPPLTYWILEVPLACLCRLALRATVRLSAQPGVLPPVGKHALPRQSAVLLRLEPGALEFQPLGTLGLLVPGHAGASATHGSRRSNPSTTLTGFGLCNWRPVLLMPLMPRRHPLLGPPAILLCRQTGSLELVKSCLLVLLPSRCERPPAFVVSRPR